MRTFQMFATILRVISFASSSFQLRITQLVKARNIARINVTQAREKKMPIHCATQNFA